ncbi:WYL domain-containing protein [Pseudonocardia eucalypti]|uniref:WYL domain-containing protein n=1 Tax=Pseudonocardia eucalypti TaxID=648755 RepID=A0ABP9Q219_9PSEU|nr:proteasome accessory factor C [Pseudonocardia eucalypti]
MSSPAQSSRLTRMLSLVPYLLARPGVRVAEAAADFGVSEKQLWRDLELLWMCGLPGYGPGDLVDLSFSEDTVTVTEDAGMRRPLRLTTAEATALLVALRALLEVPGMVDGEVVRRAVAKIESAVGAAEAPAPVAVGLAVRPSLAGDPVRVAEEPLGDQVERTTAVVREALDGERALRIKYYTASRDVVSERVVDPMRLLLVEGRGYLEAWCRSAKAVRLFRLDRVDEATRLEERRTLPRAARPADLSAGLFRPDPTQGEATLLLEPEGRWVAEYYPVEDPVERDGGRLEVRMRFTDEAWLVRLVLGLGGSARVLHPEPLRAAVAERAEAALNGLAGG